MFPVSYLNKIDLPISQSDTILSKICPKFLDLTRVYTVFFCHRFPEHKPRYSRTQYSRFRLFAIGFLLLNLSIRVLLHRLTRLFAIFFYKIDKNL